MYIKHVEGQRKEVGFNWDLKQSMVGADPTTLQLQPGIWKSMVTVTPWTTVWDRKQQLIRRPVTSAVTLKSQLNGSIVLILLADMFCTSKSLSDRDILCVAIIHVRRKHGLLSWDLKKEICFTLLRTYRWQKDNFRAFICQPNWRLGSN